MHKNKWSMLTACFFLTLSIDANAQNDADALRYSTINWGSTARSLGMGNAFSALGADPSVMATNPAGLGFYRRSEFTFTPAFQLRNTDSEFHGGSVDKNSFKFNFGNLAFVWAFPKEDENAQWKEVTFGLGYNKLNDYNSKSFAEGVNHSNSLVDSWVFDLNDKRIDQSNIVSSYPFDAGLGWDAYLFDPDTSTADTLDYVSGLPGGGALQRRTFESKGGMGEFDISLAGNYMDKLYIGGSIGIVSVRYREDVTWEEIDESNSISSDFTNLNFKSFKYTQNLKTEGSGFNIKFGIIYRPVEYVRIGAAIHTPSFLSLTDDFKSSVKSEFEGGISYDVPSPDFLPFEYDVTTPFRAMGSLGFVIGKYGLVGVEYEYLNYGSSDISPRDDAFQSDFINVNKNIEAKYAESHNFRIGGELRYNVVRFRVGGGISTTPFSNDVTTTDDTDQSRMNVNGGIGFREKNFYFDAGYSFTQSGAFQGVYAVDGKTTGVEQTTRDHRLLFTLGWSF
jgi:hypothetical protein